MDLRLFIHPNNCRYLCVSSWREQHRARQGM
jgi:hypothetical protein